MYASCQLGKIIFHLRRSIQSNTIYGMTDLPHIYVIYIYKYIKTDKMSVQQTKSLFN